MCFLIGLCLIDHNVMLNSVIPIKCEQDVQKRARWLI